MVFQRLEAMCTSFGDIKHFVIQAGYLHAIPLTERRRIFSYIHSDIKDASAGHPDKFVLFSGRKLKMQTAQRSFLSVV